MDSEELVMKFVAIDEITNVLGGIGDAIQNLVSNVMGKLGGAGEAISGTIGGLVAGLGALIAVGTGVFAAADKMASATAKYSVEVERNSHLLNGNTTLLQTVYQAGEILGQSIDNINTRLTFFNKNIEGGGTTLKKYGLSLADLGITTTAADQALLQLADTFHNSDNAGLKVAATTALFGRNAAGIIPLLNLGSDGIRRLTDEFRSFGLVLDDGTLKMNAAGGVMQERFHLIMQGLAMTIGSQLIPAFMVLWTVLGKVAGQMGQTGGVISWFTNIVAQAVIWVASLIAALTGTSISLGDFTNALGDSAAMLSLNQGAAQDAGGGIDQAGNAAKGAANNTKGLTEALKDQTQAIQDQIDALHAQMTASDEASQTQIDNLNNQTSAYNDLIDAQRAALQGQIAAMDLAQRQADALANVADIQSRIAADQAELARAPYLGITDTSSINKKLEADQDALSKAQTKITFDANRQQLEDKVKTLDDQKKAQDSVFADQIKGIQAVKKANDDALNDQIKNLEAQKAAVQKAGQEQLAAMQGAAAGGAGAMGGMAAGVGGAMGNIKGVMDNFKNALSNNFADMAAKGKAFGDWIKNELIPFLQKLWPIMVTVAKTVWDWTVATVTWINQNQDLLKVLIPIAVVMAGLVVVAVGLISAFLAIGTAVATMTIAGFTVAGVLSAIGVGFLVVIGIISSAFIVITTVVNLFNGWKAIAPILGDLWKAVSDFVSNVIGGIQGLVNDLAVAWKKFSDDPAYWIGYTIGWIITEWDKLSNWIQTTTWGMVTAVINNIAQLPGNIANLLGRAWSAVFGWGQQMITQGPSAVWQMVQQIGSALGGLPGLMWNAGWDAIQGLLNGLWNRAGDLWTAAWNIARHFIDGLKKGLSASPFPGATIAVGVEAAKGLAYGAEQQQMEVAAAGGRVGGALVSGARASVPAAPVAVSVHAGAADDQEVLGVLRDIRDAMTRKGSSTGLEALVQQIIEKSSYQHARGVATYAS